MKTIRRGRMKRDMEEIQNTLERHQRHCEMYIREYKKAEINEDTAVLEQLITECLREQRAMREEIKGIKSLLDFGVIKIVIN